MMRIDDMAKIYFKPSKHHKRKLSKQEKKAMKLKSNFYIKINTASYKEISYSKREVKKVAFESRLLASGPNDKKPGSGISSYESMSLVLSNTVQAIGKNHEVFNSHAQWHGLQELSDDMDRILETGSIRPHMSNSMQENSRPGKNENI